MQIYLKIKQGILGVMVNYESSALHTFLYLTVPFSTLPKLFQSLEARADEEIHITDRFSGHLGDCIFPVVIETLKLSIYSALAGYYMK